MWNFTLNVIVSDIPKEETRIKNYINNAGTTSIRDKYNTRQFQLQVLQMMQVIKLASNRFSH